MYIDIPIYYLHHHPAYWTDPYVFNPERYVYCHIVLVFFANNL